MRILVFSLLCSMTSACATPMGRVVRVDTPEMPLVHAALYFPFGSGSEAEGYEGSTLLLSRWMEFGTQELDAVAFNQAALALGASIGTSVYSRFTLVTVEAPKDAFVQAWDLMLQRVRHPRLRESDLEASRKELIAAKRGRLTNPRAALKQLIAGAVYAGTPDARSEVGKEATLASLTAKDLRRLHSEGFAQGPAVILVSRSMDAVTEKTVKRATETWHAPFQTANPQPHRLQGRRLLILERPGSSQAYLFFAKAGPMPGTADHALVSIGTQILGSNGGNSSILFDELRAKRGLTYHASIQTSKVPNRQWIYGLTFGANEKIGELASLYVSEWQKFYERQYFSEAELEQADSAYRAMRDRDSGETMEALIRTAAEALSVSGDVSPIWSRPEFPNERFNAAKAKWLEPQDFTLIVLGDSSKVREPLERVLGPSLSTTVLPPESDWDAVSAAVAH